MRSRLSIVLGFILLLLVFGGGLFVFSYIVALRSDAITNGVVELATSIPDDSVMIYRNDYGIPHIVGGSDNGAFFGIGYVHAQDRLWQMDFSRRVAQGRLSEIFGKRTLQTDIFLRHIEFKATAKKLAKHISSSSREALQAYCDGVNAYIEQHKHKLPVEFDILRYTPEPWTIEDCLMISRLMAWELNMSFWTDAAFGELAATIGYERALELVPQYPAGAPAVTHEVEPVVPTAPEIIPPSGLPIQQTSTATTQKKISSALPVNPSEKQLFSRFLQNYVSVRENIGYRGSSIGSNCWSIHAMKDSIRKGAILANDPHLSLSLPPRWYQAHLSAPKLNVIGMTIPGLPFVVIGRNDSIAWGITNMMVDDCDFFVETLDSTGQKYYLNSNGEQKKLTIITDTVLVKDSAEAVIYIRKTGRSAVISDSHPYRKGGGIGDTLKAENPYLATTGLTFEWVGHTLSDDVLAMYRLNKAHSWNKFLRAVSNFTVPGLNFHYADSKGNIGVAPRGRIPIRKGNYHPNFPVASAQGDWSGFVEPDSLPKWYNPEQGFVASANNATSLKYGRFISNLWEPPSRAIRLQELLTLYGEYSANEASIMQNDVVSPYARELTPLIVEDLTTSFSSLTKEEIRIFNLLQSWDFSMDDALAAPTIFNMLIERITYLTLQPHIGTDLYRRYCYITSVPTRKIAELLAMPTSPWFDNPTTSNRQEIRKDVIRKAVKEVIQQGKQLFGNDSLEQWNWGKIHTITLRHPLGEPPLRSLFSSQPLNIGGNNTTLLNSEWSFMQPYEVRVGASVRFIADMSDTVVRMILPGGNSGQPLSPHYANQTPIWHLGGTISLPVAALPNPSSTEILILKSKHQQ